MLIHVSCSYAHGNSYSGLVRLARTISGGSTVAVGGGTNTQSAYTPVRYLIIEKQLLMQCIHMQPL